VLENILSAKQHF